MGKHLLRAKFDLSLHHLLSEQDESFPAQNQPQDQERQEICATYIPLSFYHPSKSTVLKSSETFPRSSRKRPSFMASFSSLIFRLKSLLVFPDDQITSTLSFSGTYLGTFILIS